jgi:hypothetical protein
MEFQNIGTSAEAENCNFLEFCCNNSLLLTGL